MNRLRIKMTIRSTQTNDQIYKPAWEEIRKDKGYYLIQFVIKSVIISNNKRYAIYFQNKGKYFKNSLIRADQGGFNRD